MLFGRSWSSSNAPSARCRTTGAGRNGARDSFTPTGPAPGPPPPCGVENVLCRLKCMTSMPWSPGRVTPSIAFRFAPSPYTRPPFACTTSQISPMWRSKIPSVFGFVIMSAATPSSIAAATVSGCRMPSAPAGIETTA